MNLELTTNEAEELARVLDQYLAEFHDEIARTDRRDLKAAMQTSHEGLLQLKGKVDALLAAREESRAPDA